MKFKVGDKVRVREWDDMASEFGIDFDGDIMCPNQFFVKGMKVYCDNVLVINKVLELDNSYVLKGLEGVDDYDFNDAMLIPYQFTKEDLKTGMVVETRNGNRYMVYGTHLVRNLNYVDLNNYDQNMKCVSDNDFDIMKCFDIYDDAYSIEDIISPNKCYLDLLWKRKPEEKVISSNEAFKVLKEHYGCDVKIKES